MRFFLPKNTVITLDGLAASGKSSVAKGMATALDVPFISSGLLYRLVTYSAIVTKTQVDSQEALLTMLEQNQLRFEAKTSGNLVHLNQINVTDQCFSSEVDAGVSIIAQHPRIRAWVNQQIRQLEPPFVAEGRDMGTNVFPNASVKIFLSASSLVRAKRRVAERNQNLAEIQANIEARDAMDANNSTPALDAMMLDSSELNLEQTIEQALKFIKIKLG